MFEALVTYLEESSNCSTYGSIAEPESFEGIPTYSHPRPDLAFALSKTHANFLRIVKVGVRVALVLLASYNMQSIAEHKMT